MNWLIIPIEDLKQFDPHWETRRKNIDGTKALLHDTLYQELVPQVLSIDEETTYPYELVRGENITSFLDTSEWSTNEL